MVSHRNRSLKIWLLANSREPPVSTSPELQLQKLGI